MSGEGGLPTIGIIFPPPELRNIVDKTAGFVARNGPEFEARIQQNEQNNPKFNFLKQGDPYNAYYRNKVKELREAKDKPASNSSSAANSGSVSNSGSNQKQKSQLEGIIDARVVLKEPPPDFEFISDPPSLSSQDLDIVKLTAQFVAIHGRSFLTNLMTRESRNYQFDFLRPQHGLFSYFTQLIEQYTKILMPSKNICEELKNEIKNDDKLMSKIKYRLEFTKIREAEKRREEEEAERERIMYAQIDWHDFVLVESVDYQPGETGLFPPPTTPEQVGSRILLQQRIEEQGQSGGTIEMEVDSDEEGQSNKSKAKNQEPIKMMPPPIPPSLDNVLIKKDYDPKAKVQVPSSNLVQNSSSGSKKDAWVISPITGEKIPADKLQDHMRYGLLDPRWVQERERTINEKKVQEEVFAPGTDIGSSLSRLAERRTDIFGSGLEETAIGRKMSEESSNQASASTSNVPKVTWDGYKSSSEATRSQARQNISIEEQIQQIHKVKGLLPDPEGEKAKVGPSSSIMLHPPTRAAMAPPPMQVMPQLGQVLISSTQGPFMVPAPIGLPYFQGGDPMGGFNYNQGIPNPGMAFLDPNLEPSAAKKQKTEETLIPETQFLESNENPITIKVAVPQIDDNKSDWQLNGQNLSMTFDLKETISEVKKRIHESTGMPPGKQKLQFEGMFIKDANSLAYYNMTTGSVIQLQMKERGGRKK